MPGGVQQTIVGLASGLSRLDDGEEEYLFLAEESSSGWLRGHLGGSARLLPWRRAPASAGLRNVLRAVVPAPLLDAAVQRVAGRLPLRVPASDGTAEQAGAHVMHFALQQGFRTSLPSIFVPHDLQHRHHPEFFSRFELRWRETFYPALSRQADRVVALSRWGKRDLVDQLGVPPEKIHVIGWAPVLDAYEVPADADLVLARTRLGLPEAFAYYPAQTYRHKNHLRLLEALALLRDRFGLVVPLFCSGRKSDFYPTIERAVRRLRLESSVRFLGFVAPLDIQILYRLARLLVFPSLFEGFGMPVQEAFRAGVPVACSSATSLPELAGDAALLFDPESAEAIAETIRRLWTNAPLRADLIARGRGRIAGSSWTSIARTYRALYRLIAGRRPTDDDAALLRASSQVTP
jgi:glycosyltransferase involved in cell wall biosynthesis